MRRVVRLLFLGLVAVGVVVGIRLIPIPQVNLSTWTIPSTFPQFTSAQIFFGLLWVLLALLLLASFFAVLRRYVIILPQGNEAVVERLGRYQRTLKPGLNFVIPFVDKVTVAFVREQLLDIEPQDTITKDHVALTVSAILSWKILNVERAYYAVENVEQSLMSLVLTTLRSEIGFMDLRETISSRNKIGQVLLKELDQPTATWGVELIRVEVEKITLPPTLEKALENELAAESERRASISKADGTVESIRRIAKVLKEDKEQAATILQHILAQRYLDACERIGEGDNSRVLFMNPKVLTESVLELLNSEPIKSKDED